VASVLPQSTDTTGDFTMFDMDGDRAADLVYVKRRSTGTGTIEVHAYSAASGFQTSIRATGSAFSTAEDARGSFLIAHVDGDAIPDLVFVKRRDTASGAIEVHSRSGSSSFQAKVLSVATALPQAYDTRGDFLLQSIDGDATKDFVFIKRTSTGSGAIEVHALRGGQY